VLAVLELPITLPVVPVSVVHDTPIVTLNYDAGETIGWPAFVRQIAAVYRSLPPAQRSATIVLASNYCEAGRARSITWARLTGCRPLTAVTCPSGIGGRHLPGRPPRSSSATNAASSVTAAHSDSPHTWTTTPTSTTTSKVPRSDLPAAHQHLAGHMVGTKTLQLTRAGSGPAQQAECVPAR
jgi:hypothetical protein